MHVTTKPTNLFTHSNLTQIHKEIEEKQMSLNFISFRYQRGEILINSEGHSFTNKEPDYFENIKENLEFADVRWLAPICHLFPHAIIDAKVKVNPDGEFEHSKIEVVVNQMIPKEQLVEQFMYDRLHDFIKFRHYLEGVEFKGFEYNIRHMIFTFQINGKEVHSLLNHAAPNAQIKNQWLATIAQVALYNKGRFRFCDKVPVVNGKFNYSASQSVLSFKFGRKDK